MQDLVYEKLFKVHTYETDTKGDLSITGLLNYLQDIASAHASILHFGREELDKLNRYWVLSRIFCKTDRMPEWNENLVIRTWPRGIDRLFALRDFEISDEKGDRLGSATSCWIMVNSTTRKPVRPENLLAELDGEPPKIETHVRLPGKLQLTTDKAYRSPVRRVRYSDLDINIHVNNVKYLHWVLDTYPLDFSLSNRVASVEINYLSESVPGDEVTMTAQEDGNFFLHSIYRENAGKEACRIRIEWQPCVDSKVY